MTENPFASPIAQPNSVVDQPASAPTRALMEIAKATFLAWEKLRIAYIVLLGIVTLAVTGSHISDVEVIAAVAVGAIVANICYFAGPIVETYICWLGFDHKWVRWLLFVSGTLLTALVAVDTIVLLIGFVEK